MLFSPILLPEVCTFLVLCYYFLTLFWTPETFSKIAAETEYLADVTVDEEPRKLAPYHALVDIEAPNILLVGVRLLSFQN